MTARAARLEQEVLVTQVWLASSERVFQGYQRDIFEDSATLPLTKGRKGFVRGEA